MGIRLGMCVHLCPAGFVSTLPVCVAPLLTVHLCHLPLHEPSYVPGRLQAQVPAVARSCSVQVSLSRMGSAGRAYHLGTYSLGSPAQL